MEVKWRKKRNVITEVDSIGTRNHRYKSGIFKLYQFQCLICKKLMEMRQGHIVYSTGKCKKHANMLRPFQAVYGGMKRNAKERNKAFNLTYEDYLSFTGKNCYYCNLSIPWNPYNEHGKNNPGYYIDCKNSKLGYIKSNCVSCCTKCNRAKGTLSDIEFIDLCQRIAKKGGSCGS